jgi:hypothetical protein
VDKDTLISKTAHTKLWKAAWEHAKKKLKKPAKKFSQKDFRDHVLPHYLENKNKKTGAIENAAYKIAAKEHEAPSRKPNSEWFDKMYKEIEEANPGYSEEQIRKTIGSIWYKNLSGQKRKQIRERSGKTYKPK